MLHFLHFVFQLYEVEISLPVRVVEEYYVFLYRILYGCHDIGVSSFASVNFVELLVLVVEQLLPTQSEHAFDSCLEVVLELFFLMLVNCFFPVFNLLNKFFLEVVISDESKFIAQFEIKLKSFLLLYCNFDLFG